MQPADPATAPDRVRRRPMRLCVVTDSYPATTETFVYEPVGWLRNAGHRVDVLTGESGALAGAARGEHPAIEVGHWRTRATSVAQAIGSPRRVLRLARSAWAWRGMTETPFAATLNRSLIPQFAEAEHVLAHFGPVGL